MEKIFQILSEFENVTLRKSQWLIIMKAAGCPKSMFLWEAFRNIVLERSGYYYTMRGLTFNVLCSIWNEYNRKNRESVKKVYDKKKEQKKFEERKKIAQAKAAEARNRKYAINPDGTIVLFSDYLSWQD